MDYPTVAAGAVRLAQRIPTFAWAAWIAGIVIGTAALAIAYATPV